MYCPQCGQQQVSDVTRFCSRCGFLLDGVTAVLASGGQVPMRYVQPGSTKLSPRSIGVRQGALLMLSTLLLVPLVAIITGSFIEPLMFLIPVTAIFCFVGGLLRILYALMMEDPYPKADLSTATGFATGIPQVDTSVRSVALPPAAANPTAGGWRPRTNTAEIYQPPSITENTTRLLDKDDPKSR